MPINFQKRLDQAKIRAQAAAVGKTVEVYKEDLDHHNEKKDIESQEKEERPFYTMTETGMTTGGNPYDDPDFRKPAKEDDWAQKLADEQGAGGSFRKTRNKIQASNDFRRFGYEAGKKIAGYEKMYPDSYTDSVRSDKTAGLKREREVYQGSTFDKLRKRKQEIQQKVASQEITPAEAEESFENYRQGLFKEINIEKAGGFSGEFQGVGVMPEEAATGPRITGYVEDPKVEALETALETASKKEGLMPIGGIAAAEEQSDFQRDEENPAVKQMRDVQKKAAEGDPDAEKTRKELFEGKSKEETAMAKEELGNYYIGPGGYAINLDTVDASAERLANMSLLQHIPAHARAQMLASWGYIDQEDVDKSPDDPKISVAEIQAASAIAVIRATSEGTLANTKEQTRSAEVIKTGQYKNNTDLSTMNNDLQTKLKKMDIDWEDLKQHSVEIMHLNDLDLDEWKTEKGFKLRKEEMKDVRDHFAKEMTFKYKNITNVNGFKNAQLAQQGATNLMNYNLKSDAQQKAWLVNQHDMTMSRVTSLYDAGNPEAAMMVYQTLDPNTPVNITGFWKKLAKTSTFANPEVEKEFEKIYGEGGAKKGINNYVNAKIKLRTKFNKTTLNDDGYTELDRWVKDNQENNNFTERLGPVWSEMSDEQQNEVAGGYPAWKSEMISKAINYQMGQGEFRGVYNAMESNKIKITSGRTGEGVPKVETVQPLIDDDNLNESSVTKKVDQKKIKTKIEKANETMKGELARGNKDYTTKFGSAFRGPSSKIEALKLGEKEVTTGMLKFKRNKKFPMPLDELLKKPKALVKYLKNNIEYYKLLSPAAQFWVAQEAQNQKKL